MTERREGSALTAKAVGPTPWQRRIRGVLVVGYVAAIVLGLATGALPRLFWTMLLPLLPMSIVLMGFPNWRRICPLAFLGELGRKLNRGTQRRAPKWLAIAPVEVPTAVGEAGQPMALLRIGA